MPMKKENSWDVESIYEFQFYNCPTCEFKHYTKQDFVNHAFNTHTESVQDLRKISDGSLSDIFPPWNSNDITSSESKDANFIDEIQIPNMVEAKNQCGDNILEIVPGLTEENNIAENSESTIDDPLELDKPILKNTNDEHLIFLCGHKNCKFSSQSSIDLENHRQQLNHCEIEKTEKSNNTEIRICTNCNESFSNINDLQVHIDKVHEGCKYYKCDICNKSFSTEEDSLNHKVSYHHHYSQFKCKYCSETFSEYAFLNSHYSQFHCEKIKPNEDEIRERKTAYNREMRKKSKKCDECGKKYVNYRNHVIRKCPKAKNPSSYYFCYICDETVADSESLKRHLKNMHDPNGKKINVEENEPNAKDDENIIDSKMDSPLKGMDHEDFEKNDELIMEVEDEFSGKIFSEENIEKGKDSKNDLPNGKKIDEKENEPNPKNEENISDSKDLEKNYQVKDEFAGEIFSKENIEKEKNSKNYLVDLKENYKCYTCGKSFLTKTNLKIHLYIHKESNPKKVHNDIHSCNFCEKTFSHKDDLTLHKYTVHKDGYKGPHECSHCEKGFFLEKNLQKHIFKEHNAFKVKHICDSCGKAFTHTRLLGKHIKYIHEGLGKCDFCGKFYENQTILRNHIYGVHEGYKDHVCESCGKSYSTKAQLKRHVEVHNNAPKPKDKLCQLCGKNFITEKALEKHFHIIHEGHKDYKCNVCGKEFARSTDVRQHNNKFHLKKFLCKTCGKSFGESSRLKMHFNNVHEGHRDFKCDVCGKTFSQRGDRNRHIKKYHKPTDLL